MCSLEEVSTDCFGRLLQTVGRAFAAVWTNLLAEIDEDATLATSLSEERFRITDTQSPRVVIEFVDFGESNPLKREQFETLVERVEDSPNGFELDRLPPEADPYPTVLSLHPRFEVDTTTGTLHTTDEPTPSELLQGVSHDVESDRSLNLLSSYRKPHGVPCPHLAEAPARTASSTST